MTYETGTYPVLPTLRKSKLDGSIITGNDSDITLLTFSDRREVIAMAGDPLRNKLYFVCIDSNGYDGIDRYDLDSGYRDPWINSTYTILPTCLAIDWDGDGTNAFALYIDNHSDLHRVVLSIPTSDSIIHPVSNLLTYARYLMYDTTRRRVYWISFTSGYLGIYYHSTTGTSTGLLWQGDLSGYWGARYCAHSDRIYLFKNSANNADGLVYRINVASPSAPVLHYTDSLHPGVEALVYYENPLA